MTRLLATEARLFRRDPAAAFFGMVLPVAILAIIGSAPGTREVSEDLGGVRVIDTYVPTLALLAFTTLAVSSMPSVLASYRERGVLRRLATTPVSPTRLLGAQLAVHATAALVAAAVVVAVGHVAFDVPLPDPLAGFLVALALSGATLLALGLLVAAVAPSARVAGVLGAVLFFPMMFLGGLWFPRAAMDGTLLAISDHTPVGAAVGALQEATTGGGWPSTTHVLVLAAWGLVAGALAGRLFRWE